ncbi:MAG: ATP-binding cassette domain-containing protein [Candidatus Cloacimonetes bacterium]|nr:ATP-binding cassette domain-containing protein [Candidatus Cloacimonadota bacterium]
MSNGELLINNLSLKFENNIIFKDVNLNCSSGSITIIKGKNGSGKTCLLQCICSVIPKHFAGIVEGEIALENSKTHSPSYFGYLMQDPDKQLCFPFIEEELFFGAENLKRDIDDFNTDYEMLLEMFPVLKQEDIETSELSFGQKKILLFSAMILKNPLIFLLDEPSAGLSEDYRMKFVDLILSLKKKGKILIIAEHETFFDNIGDATIWM